MSRKIDLDSLRDEVDKHFNHALKQHENARNSGEEEISIYWQGRKDAVRNLRVVFFGSEGNYQDLAAVLDNEETYKSPDPDDEEITELKPPESRLIK